MTKEREALKKALEALEKLTGPADLEHPYDALDLGDVTVAAIKELLAQPRDSAEPTHTPEQLAALGWQSIECPFCGTSGAQAFSKSALAQSGRWTLEDMAHRPGGLTLYTGIPK